MNKWLSKKLLKIDDLVIFVYKNFGINQYFIKGIYIFEDLLVKVWYYYRGMKFIQSQFQFIVILLFCLEVIKYCMFCIDLVYLLFYSCMLS